MFLFLRPPTSGTLPADGSADVTPIQIAPRHNKWYDGKLIAEQVMRMAVFGDGYHRVVMRE